MKQQREFIIRQSSLILLLCVCVCCSTAQGIMVDTKNVKCKGEANGEATVTGGKAPQPYTYKWSHNPGASGKTVKDLKKGNHSVTVTDANGCTATAEFEIDEPDDPLGTILKSSDPQHDFCANTFQVTVTAYGQGGTPQYHWPDGRTKTITAPGRYCFITFDKNNCVDVECISFAEAMSACRGSVDPNDIVGPQGFDELQWMSSKTRHDYMIRFENDPNLATGPAQYVEVRHPIDPKVNPLSVRLSSFGFGAFIFEVPENASFYQERLDLIDELGFYLDVVCGLDVVENEVFWRLETIDPMTGLRPIDLTIGFLPPNDTLVNDGQGFVTYSVLPKANVQTRDTVSADAIIIFDKNEPIATNIWQNTIDAYPPTSSMVALPDTTYSNEIELFWSAMDDANGSGVGSYDLYVSINNGPFVLDQTELLESAFVFKGEPGTEYAFFVIAVDNTGNKEVKTLGEASTFTLPLKSLELLAPLSQSRCIGDSLVIEWSSVLVDSIEISVSLDSGQTFAALSGLIPSASSSFVWVIPDTAETAYAQVRIVSPADTIQTDGPLFAINALPVVDAGPQDSLCINAVTNLIASGAYTYAWAPLYNISQPNNYKTLAYPDTTTTYTVTGTSAFGCQNTDSVTLTVLPTFIDSVVHEMCEGDSVFVGGGYQTNAGYYTDELFASNGCDSTVVTLVVLTGPCGFPSPVVYVDEDATGLNNGTSWLNAFNDLQDALVAVETYDDVNEIWVAEGTYFTTNDGDREISFMLRDSVKVYGGFIGVEITREERTADASLVLVSGDIGIQNDSTDNAFHVIRGDVSCTGCTLDGMTLQFGQADFIFNQAFVGGGILNEGVLSLNNCVIERNTAMLEGAAIFNSGSAANLLVKDCIFRLNTSGLERDILNIDGASIRFQGLNQVQE